jgi:hypothetical protein
MFANCSLYNANCSHLIASEWGDWGDYAPTAEDQAFTANLATAYQSILATFPSNVSLNFHEFEYTNNWTDGYIKRREFVSQSRGNYVYITYNVTKLFATYCPAGGTVYQSSSDGSNIKTVSCKIGSNYSIIVINSENNTNNVSLSGLPSGITSLTDSNGATYSVSSNSVNLGIQDSYGIVYLSHDSTCPYPQTLNGEGICEYAVETGCSTLTRTGYSLVMILSALALLVFVFVTAYNGFKEGSVSVGQLITLFVVIIVCLALWISSGQNLGGSCGVVG